MTIKIKNASIWSGDKYRKNQNYTMNLFKNDGINVNSTVE